MLYIASLKNYVTYQKINNKFPTATHTSNKLNHFTRSKLKKLKKIKLLRKGENFFF